MAYVEIYTKPTCPYCRRAKALLDELGAEYDEYDIAESPELREEMIDRADGRTTVPQIFINDEGIGGCDDMVALHEQGELEPMLDAEDTREDVQA